MTSRRPAKHVWASLLASSLAAGSCSRTTEPSTDLTGDWDFEYFTQASQACPRAPEPHWAGCGGGGRLSLAQTGSAVTGSLMLWGYCDSCGAIGDSFGMPRTLTGRIRGDRLELEMTPCRYSALVGSGVVDEVSGTATCFVDRDTRGEWRMTRVD